MSDKHRLRDPKALASGPIEETLVFSDGTHPEGDAPPQTPSKKFGRYEIQRVLGEGAMGAVLLATDTQLQREVALKIPKFAHGAAPQMLERFFLEARLAATLSHPNICPVFDVGEIDGTHYISMAYIEGHPLSDFINSNKPQGERQISQVVRKLALALKEAHAKGVVHRDLKPANVMIDKRGEPVIMDFGIALQENTEDTRLTREGQLVGSPAYMSPEQMGGVSSEIGPATDIYSLGVVFYELLTGELPFEGTGSMASIIGEVLTKEPKDLKALRPGLDPALAAICMKAMAKKVGNRFESMSELAAALTQFLKQAQQTTVLGADSQVVSMGDTIASAPVDNNLLDDLAEALPPLAQSAAAQGTLLVASSKQSRWVLPTAIGLAIVVPALLIWALSRDNSTPVEIADSTSTSQTTDAISTNKSASATSTSDKPAPPVASQSVFSETSKRPQPDQAEKPPQPSRGIRGPRFGPLPGLVGRVLPLGISVDEFFRKFDKNQDNKLTPDELPDEVRDRMFRADANRDGYLVKKELRDAEGGPGKRRRGKKPR